VRRGLLLTLIVLVAVLAWPAMTPGLFSGEGVHDAWIMAEETTHEIVYSPRFRQVRVRAHAWARQVQDWGPIRTFEPAEVLPTLEREVVKLYDDFIRYPHRRKPSEYKTRPRSPFTYAGWMFGVPEPSVWVMMIGGFGLVGQALRAARAAGARRSRA
jgi:hypothetical protein